MSIVKNMCYNNRIHILGVGNIGKFVAHALRKQHPSLRITLLFHRPGLVCDWDAAGRTIVCVTDGRSDQQAGFDVEIIYPSAHQSCSRVLESPIEHLIVATKTHVTSCALSLVKHRLRSSSSILFLQNGIGTLDEVSAEVFSAVDSRPSYLVGICSCSIYCTSPFSIIHAGPGAIEVGLVCGKSYGPMFGMPTDPLPHQFMAQLFHKTPKLEATLLTPHGIKEAQLRKLTVNAVINPMTAIFRCKIGELLDHPQRFALMVKLFEEVADIVHAIMSQASGISVDSVLWKEKLWLPVLRVAENAKKSTSSMLQDIEVGRRTEIDYINGYIATQGHRLGFPCIYNNVIIEMIRKRRVIRDDEIDSTFWTPEIISTDTPFLEKLANS